MWVPLQEFPGVDRREPAQSVVRNDGIKPLATHYRIELVKRFNSLDCKIQPRTTQSSKYKLMVDCRVLEVQDTNRSIIGFVSHHGAHSWSSSVGRQPYRSIMA
jgi:hypothetical protein